MYETDIEQDQTVYPEPLHMFKEKIAPKNQEILQREEARWRLLGFWQRRRMRRMVRYLAKSLKAWNYNGLIAEFAEKRRAFGIAKRAGDRAAMKAAVIRAKEIQATLDELQPTVELHQHYSGWLKYERAHRAELKEDAKRLKRRRKEMREEVKLLKDSMIDVWRHADHCHYTYKDDGKEITKVPEFDRVVVKPDAHWMYVRISKKTIFGYRYKLPNAVLPHHLEDEDVIKALKSVTKRDVHCIWTDSHQMVFRVSRLDSPSALPRMVKWSDAMRFYPRDDSIMPYCIGATERHKWKWYDVKGKPHLLVAGSSESGKSNLVNGIIATNASMYSPRELRIVLIDMKGGIEFTHWDELPHVLWDMVKDVDEAEARLEHLVHIMKRRNGIQAAVKAKNINAYNAKVDPDKRLERVLVVIDELNNFVGLGAQTERIHNLLALLTSQGRAVGIHVIMSTQHAEVKVIPGRIQTNAATRMCGWVPNIHASMNVLGTPEATRIDNIPGRFAANAGRENIVVQVPYITDQDIQGVVSSARQQWTEVTNELSDMQAAPTPAAIVWNEQRVLKECANLLAGHLSGQKLHLQLGTESPGERHLCRMVNNLKETAESLGVVELHETGQRWIIKQRGKGFYLKSPEEEKDQE